jgi:hypothetical protein
MLTLLLQLLIGFHFQPLLSTFTIDLKELIIIIHLQASHLHRRPLGVSWLEHNAPLFLQLPLAHHVPIQQGTRNSSFLRRNIKKLNSLI